MSFSLETLKKQDNVFAKNAKKKVAGITGSSQLAALQRGSLTSSTPLETRIQKNSRDIIEKTSQILQENRTELLFFIDASNSCSGLERANQMGYDKLIKKEQKSDYPTKVTTLLFSHVVQEIDFRQDISKVQKLNYTAHGGTAFYDIFCTYMSKIKESIKKAPIKPKKKLAVIMTDGEDEHSHVHSLEDTKKMISECQKEGWEFLFLGAFTNAKKVAEKLGIDLNLAIETESSITGTLNSFSSIEKALDDLKKYGKITDHWSHSIKKTSSIEEKTKRLRLQ